MLNAMRSRRPKASRRIRAREKRQFFVWISGGESVWYEIIDIA
jgi:hypothetical protein